jgi:hypothetical protein
VIKTNILGKYQTLCFSQETKKNIIENTSKKIKEKLKTSSKGSIPTKNPQDINELIKKSKNKRKKRTNCQEYPKINEKKS